MNILRAIILVLLFFILSSSLYAQDLLKELNSIDKESNSSTPSAPTRLIDRISLPNFFLSTDMLASLQIPTSERLQYKHFDFTFREVEFTLSGNIDHILYYIGGFSLESGHTHGAGGHNHNTEENPAEEHSHAHGTGGHVHNAIGNSTQEEHNHSHGTEENNQGGGHSEGDFSIALHDVYIAFPNLFKGFTLRIGNILLDIGKQNSIHFHDRHFTTSPIVLQRMFNSDHGVSDFGIDASYVLPYPIGIPFVQTLKFGVFLGRRLGHSLNLGTNKAQPLYLAGLDNFFRLSKTAALEINLSFVRYSIDENPFNADYFAGTDAFFQWRKLHYRLRIGGEFWYTHHFRVGEEDDTDIGYFLYSTFTFLNQYTFGYRWGHNIEEDRGAENKTRKEDMEHAVWFEYKTSEFARFRFTFEYHDSYSRNSHNHGSHSHDSNKKNNEFVIYLQMTFALGTHPTHNF